MSFPSSEEMVLQEGDADILMREDFMTFVEYAFGELHVGKELVCSPHLCLIAAKLEACLLGRCKRLIINVPPRSLKSIIASVAFPAWVLGREPHRQIICASYAQDLANKHSSDTRTVMSTPGYISAFGRVLESQRPAVNDFTTIAGGFRMATSVGGVLTGRGGDILIIDDPLKPEDAYSEVERKRVIQWFNGTVLSRLNEKRDGVIILVMQRLHEEDLAGHLIETGDWEVLRLPAIAEEEEHFLCKTNISGVRFRRHLGEVLDSRRESKLELEAQRRSMGSYSFEAQYQQNPQPLEGNIIKKKWLCWYTPPQLPPRFAYKVQSWDTANKSGELNDYSVCTTWGVLRSSAAAGGTAGSDHYYLLDVYGNRLEFPALERAVREQHAKHSPSWIVVEDKGSGTQIIQNFKHTGILIKPYDPVGHDKQMRLFAQSALFENGRVHLPASAPWLDEYTRELTSFPGGKHDDQVDSTTQALDHMSKTKPYGCTIQELRI